MSHEDALLEDTAVLNAIYQHWSEVWDAAAAQPLQTKLNTILRSLPTKQPCNGRPTLPEFSKARSRLSGAAGPDGWTADEIKCFPRQLNALFVAVTEQWERAGCTPQPLTFSRQVNLAKTGKNHGWLLPGLQSPTHQYLRLVVFGGGLLPGLLATSSKLGVTISCHPKSVEAFVTRKRMDCQQAIRCPAAIWVSMHS